MDEVPVVLKGPPLAPTHQRTGGPPRVPSQTSPPDPKNDPRDSLGNGTSRSSTSIRYPSTSTSPACSRSSTVCGRPSTRRWTTTCGCNRTTTTPCSSGRRSSWSRGSSSTLVRGAGPVPADLWTSTPRTLSTRLCSPCLCVSLCVSTFAPPFTPPASEPFPSPSPLRNRPTVTRPRSRFRAWDRLNGRRTCDLQVVP